VGAVDEKTIKAYDENQKWDEDDQGSKSERPPSLEPAESSGGFSRTLDFQSQHEPTGYSR
jgi:hypothetical protein